MAYAKRVNAATKYRIDLGAPDMNHSPYSVNSAKLRGKCNDWALYSVMVMRSLGIPAACEMTPYSGSVNDGHAFPALIMPDGTSVAFNGPRETGINVVNGLPKIYRRMYSIQRDTPIHKYRNSESIPAIFSSFEFRDVTALHDLRVRDIEAELTLARDVDNKVAYLAVFSPIEWMPIAYAERRGRKATFRDMGMAAHRDGRRITASENLGHGIVYLPCFYSNEIVIPAGYPIVNDSAGVRTLVPDEVNTETVILTRKFPRRAHIIAYAGTMVGGVFEAADNPDFRSAAELYLVGDTPLSRMQGVDVEDAGTYRYVRFRKPGGALNIGEMRFYDKEGYPIEGTVIAPEPLMDSPGPQKVFDGDPLTCYVVPGKQGSWVGLKFDRPASVGRIEFCPRTDDNDIQPGNQYELHYWDDGWVSLGRKVAEDYELTYREVPSNALLWLRNHTRGVEERPFTYENGRQVWW